MTRYPFRYDDPKAKTRKRAVYLAYVNGGADVAIELAASLGLAPNTGYGWVCEFKRAGRPQGQSTVARKASRKKSGRRPFTDPSAKSGKAILYAAYLKGGELEAFRVSRRLTLRSPTIAAYCNEFGRMRKRVRVPMRSRKMTWEEVAHYLK